MHTGYFNILRRSGAGQKETTSENQRFSEVFCGLMDPLVIRMGLAAYGGYVVIIREKWLASFGGVTSGVAE